MSYKKIFALGALLCLMVNAKAQYVSLTISEVKQLKKNIEADAKVAGLFDRFKRTAATALADAPNPIEKVTSQGLLMGNPAKTASLKAVEDGPKVYALALNYRLYNNKAYLTKAVEYLQAWAKINKSTGDPVDETKLEDFFKGYDLIRAETGKEERKQIDAWLESITVGQIYSKYAAPERTTSFNNWNSHRIKVIAQTAYAIHADKYRDTINKLIEKQLEKNLYPDGSSFDFEQRDALHYHIFSLEPLLKAMMTVYRATGKNYYAFASTTGSSVQKSVQFLVPFVTGEKKHGEFANSKVKFDRDRAANGEKGYIPGHPFEPKNGIIVLSLADYFDPSMLKVIRQSQGEDYSDWQLVLNSVTKPRKL